MRDEEALQQGGRLLEAVVRPCGGRQGPAPQPVAAALVAQLPTVAAGAVQPAVGGASVCDRTGACVDEDSRRVVERGGERDLDIPAHIDALGNPRRRDGRGERLPLRCATGAGRSHERDGRGQ